MKISELIDELENRKQNYGDMDVFDITGRPFTHDDLDELLTVYHGKAYEEPETVREARKTIERGY